MHDKHIFISYSRNDADFALRLAQDLRNSGEEIWLDQLDIEPGKRWDNEIEKGLKDARKLLLILSPTSVASENVMDEVSYALEEKLKIIPVMLIPCELPFRIRRLQFVDFSKDYDEGFQKLEQYLDSANNENDLINTDVAPVKVTSSTDSTITPTKKSSNPVFPKWLLGLGALLIIAFLVFQFLPEKEQKRTQLNAPNLLDKTVEEARKLVLASNLRLGSIEEVEQADKKANHIYAQTPGAGNTIYVGQAINIKVAVPVKLKPIKVPNVIKKDVRTALSLLQKAGFKPKIIKKETDCKLPPNIITNQSPSAGKQLLKGQEVALVQTADRKSVSAKRFNKGKLRKTIKSGDKYTHTQPRTNLLNITYTIGISLSGDVCTQGTIKIASSAGNFEFNLKAGQRKELKTIGKAIISFKANDKISRLYIESW